MRRYTPTLENCEDMAGIGDYTTVKHVWTGFKEKVEDLFDETLASVAGNHIVEMILVKRFAEVLEYGFEDRASADTARSEYTTCINDAMAWEDEQEAVRRHPW